MSSQTSGRPGQNPADAAAGTSSAGVTATTGGRLVTERGATSIADSVVEKIAGIAARGVPGIYAMGTGPARTFGAVRGMIPGSGGPNAAQGVSVQVGRTQAAVDLAIVPRYGYPVADLAAAVQREVMSMVERMTGLQVLEVNIAVDDMHMPGDDNHDQPPPATTSPGALDGAPPQASRRRAGCPRCNGTGRPGVNPRRRHQTHGQPLRRASSCAAHPRRGTLGPCFQIASGAALTKSRRSSDKTTTRPSSRATTGERPRAARASEPVGAACSNGPSSTSNSGPAATSPASHSRGRADVCRTQAPYAARAAQGTAIGSSLVALLLATPWPQACSWPPPWP